jgi:hypothetical protein
VRMDLSRTGAALLLTMSLLPLAVGCGSNWQNYEESFMRSGIVGPQAENVPPWVKGQMPEDEKNMYFIGRGVAYNVLDERAGYDSARDHVLQQLGRQIATWVSSRAREGDVRWFDPKSGWCFVSTSKPTNRFLPGEQSSQWLSSAVRMTSEALAGDLEEKGVYWEQWYIQEDPERMRPNELRMKRYKCWVLMSLSKEQFESRVKLTLDSLQMAAARPDAVFPVVGQHVQQGGPARVVNARGAEKLFERSR